MFQNKTIGRIGAKNLNMKSFGTDKILISVILTILANGEKLSPLIVFKGKSDKSIIIKFIQKYLLSKRWNIYKNQENVGW